MVSLRLVLLAAVLQPAVSQFKCTFAGAKDADSCTAVTDDSNEHCVWCSLGGGDEAVSLRRSLSLNAFGFCITESQAEAMEQTIPNIHCDRYHGDTDDDAAATDDTVPDDDKTPPKDDDNITPNDDSLPDNYWTCLWKKDAASCNAANCTWCDTKGGFGLCMTGPTADSAANSDWFNCKKGHDEEEYKEEKGSHSMWTVNLIPDSIRSFTGPLEDGSCLMAFLQDQTENGCTSAHDKDGNPCQWCSLTSMINVCLTKQQADMGAPLGVTCDADAATVKDPYDPSCLLAYLQESTKDACLAAVDSEGSPCEFCTLQDSLDMCLNAEQAEMGEQFGIECGQDVVETKKLNDPYDPSCLLAYLQDSTKDACLAAVDSEGNPCEFCTLQGSLDICLNAEQAEMGEQFGIECGQDVMVTSETKKLQDPYDPSCALAFLQDSTKDACVNAVDSEGNACEYCTLQGALNVCLNAEQAAMGEELGMECGQDVVIEEDSIISDPYDPSCALAYLQDSSKDACVAAADGDGNACEFCTYQGVLNLCLNQEQAEMGEEFGITCGGDAEEVALPPDFFECLEHYQDDDCRSSHCTWCNTEVGIGFCLAPAAADATKECSFFDCEFEASKKKDVADIYDPVCLNAGMQNGPNPASTCAETTGSDGKACVWCDAAGVFGLCLSSEQANAAGQFLKCNEDIAVAAE